MKTLSTWRVWIAFVEDHEVYSNYRDVQATDALHAKAVAEKAFVAQCIEHARETRASFPGDVDDSDADNDDIDFEDEVPPYEAVLALDVNLHFLLAPLTPSN